MRRIACACASALIALLVCAGAAQAIEYQHDHEYTGPRTQQIIDAASSDSGARRAILEHDTVSTKTKVFLSPSGRNYAVVFRDQGDVFLIVAIDSTDLSVLGMEKQTIVTHTVGQVGGPAFGGKFLNSPAVWWVLELVFVLLLINPRAWRSWWTLDIIALASFGVSHALYVHFRLDAAAVASFVPLLYLALSLTVRALRGDTRSSGSAVAVPRWLQPTKLVWSAFAVVLAGRWVLLAKFGLLTDVGSGNYFGAQQLVRGNLPYGRIGHGLVHADTYGLLSYLLYIPGYAVSGLVDAAHHLSLEDRVHVAAGFTGAAADLGCALAVACIARRWLGATWAPLAALAWVVFPETTWTLISTFNDPLVSLMVLLCLVFVASPVARGALLAAAAAVKIAPLAALGPVLWNRSEAGVRTSLRTLGGFAAIGIAFAIPLALANSGFQRFWDAVIDFELHRKTELAKVDALDVPSLWSVYKLGDQHHLVQAAVVILLLALFMLPRRRSVRDVALGIAAAMALVQLAADHWWYNYLVWIYAPLVPLLVWQRAGSPDIPSADD
jgi:hypothetical protein